MTSDRKIFSQANNAKISAKLSNQQKINILTKNLAKNAKLSYSLAKKKGQANPISQLEIRVLNKLRPRYSITEFINLQNALDKLGRIKKLAWFQDMDRKLRNEYK